jgi:hypothetical protein
MARRDARPTAAEICAWEFRIFSLLCPYSIGNGEEPINVEEPNIASQASVA